MKVGIVTFYRSNSCGAVLQCYALFSMVKALLPAADVRVLDYSRTERLTRPTPLSRFKEKYKRTHSLASSSYHAINTLTEQWKNKGRSNFQDFIDCFYNLDTDCSIEKDSRKLVCKDYDILITGSDQVFAGCAPYFYLDVDQDKPVAKISYAPSFGDLDKIAPEQHPWIKSRLQSFHALSCRENDGARYIEQLTGKNVETVLDPTMLHPAAFWEKLCKKPENINIKGDFVFSYELWRCADTALTSEKIANSLKLPLVRAKYYDEGIKFYNRVGPQEFLWLVCHAKHIITHSFHGLVFALIFGKPVHFVKSAGSQARITTLLSLLNRLDLRIENSSQIDLSKTFLSSLDTEQKLQQARKASYNYIIRALAIQ